MPRKVWYRDKVEAEAKKYRTPQQFKRGSVGAYNRASKDGYLNEITSQMESALWTKEKLLNVASTYDSLDAFRKSEKGAYLYAIKNGFREEATLHMERAIARKGYWNYDRCRKEAEEYSTRTDFMRGSGTAYNKALVNDWLHSICGHMETSADGYHHCVYVIQNTRLKKAYIGVTRQHLSRRAGQHKSDDNTTTSAPISCLPDTEYLALTDYNIDASGVGEAEANWCVIYRNKGFYVLNDEAQFGRVGTSDRVHTDEIIFEEAKKYSRRVDFKNGSPKIYDAAVSQRLLEKACEHMRGIKKHGFWTKEECFKYAATCEDRYEFCKREVGAYDAALINGWLEEIYGQLRSRLDMGWLKATGERKQVWLDADYYYDTWVENGCCGDWKMKRITGIKLGAIITKFKAGWIPRNDEDWLVWKNES